MHWFSKNYLLISVATSSAWILKTVVGVMESNEMKGIIEEFQHYLSTEKAKSHLYILKKKEPEEVKEVLDRLRTLPKGSEEFVELVLYGLLPYGKSKYAKRVSITPAFLNIRKFFGRFNYTENDWKELSRLIYELVTRFQEDPESLEEAIRDFVSNRLSKGLQCGSLTPIFYAINSDFPLVNNRVLRAYRKLSFLVYGEADKLSQRLEDYLSNVEKIEKFAQILSSEYGFKQIIDMALFDYMCYWYDEKSKKSGKKEKASLKERRTVEPIKESRLGGFLKTLSCSEPTPYFVAVGEARNLQKLDAENRIIYNTEYQRGKVWNTRKKQKLIDSVLRGYNINTIFLRQLDDGRFECIDGQQRLRTILNEFLNDGFPISPDITPEFNRKTYFSELPPLLKDKITHYHVFAIIFYTDKDEETCKIFLRLQEGLPLNSAEKLNAMMGFLREEVLQLTKHSFLKRIGIKDYRFAHRYMLAQNYLLTLRNQITEVKFRNLQEMYHTYAKTRPSRIVTATVNKVLNFLEREFMEDAQIIRKRADFITLFLLGKHIIENYVMSENVRIKDFFMEFVTKVGQVESSEIEENVPYFDYKTYRKTSADSRDSLKKRFDIILPKFLEFNPKLVSKDPKRDFDDWEKLAIYWRDKGVCQLCGKRITFEKGTADHIKPHSEGGTTTIDNGQWACIPCNLKKSATMEFPIAVSQEVFSLSNEVSSLIGDCNSICSSKGKEGIFRITDKTLKRISDIGKPVRTQDSFGNLVDALYEIIYEGSGSLGRIPQSLKEDDSIVFTIKLVRADLRHDLEHGKEKDIKKKRERLSRIYQRYVDKTAINSLGSRDFSKLHLDLLKEVVSFLEELKKHCVNSVI